MPVHLDAFQVIKAPIITEKMSVATERANIWGFIVDRRIKVFFRNATTAGPTCLRSLKLVSAGYSSANLINNLA